MKSIYAFLMRRKSNFRTTGISCLLSVLVALSGAISPAQANASVPATGSYICTTGVLRASGEADPTYTINNGVVTSGVNCAGAVLIPEGVTSIGSMAFRYASRLDCINIPSSVTSIGEAAFQGSGLTSITFAPFSQLTSIQAYAFSNARSLTSINIPAGVTHIEDGAFSGTTSLTEVTLPSTITIIESETFYGATALASIVIPASVATIAESAFAEATSLASITIPASVTTIEGYAFYGATALMDVNFSGNAPSNVGEDAFFGTASGAKANISATATGFGTDATWNGLNVAVIDNVPSSSSSTSDQAIAARAAEEARARAVEAAKAEIKRFLPSGKPLSVNQLLRADFNGVTTKNISLINADIAKLSDLDKTDLKHIEKVVLKFATVDKLAEGKTIYSSDLIAVGLIPQDSKIKSSITSALKKLPGSSLDSYEKIQAEIAAVEKLHADRKARLAAVLSKKR